ncbi:WavE lipopolysaccharide synthesis family protein [Hafnia alvei]|uniref:WavE lipopolysaccharide synthesis n=1 Tax=Hafnia alvei TaxID=569 RepID=A0ABD7Q6L9_HAFAL|nr:WavE lipopolysaccharide synthesis family protein [Hafnia alvei]TBL69141.1 hypothetical protein EYY96_05375 [Hafnia alvei]
MKMLSIVVQGPVGAQGTLSADVWNNLRRTRRVFPESEMIVSTWHKSPDADALLAEQLGKLGIRLVLSPDPGALVYKDSSGSHLTNLNRLLLSSRVGLEQATRPLAVKLRTDSYLKSRQIVDKLQCLVLSDGNFLRNNDYSVFSQRVINASLFARDVRGSLPYLFHPGDILLAGYREDVLMFFSAPLADHTLFHPASAAGLWSGWRFVPEQYFWVQAIYKATGRWVFEGNFNSSPALNACSEQYYLANFLPDTPRQLGFRWTKYWTHYHGRGQFSVYTFARWLRLYRQYMLGLPPKLTLTAYLDRLLTNLWKAGYRLRARFMCISYIRRAAMFLFSRRS